MSAGMLTGRPAEEMPGSAGDLLPELSELTSLAGDAEYCPSLVAIHLPARRHGGAYRKAQGAQRRIRLWKISACREGPLW